uniref:Uncharacterized protein n=1 Tax=Aplanochytrium stocchinoi TaxID=215587 RepID=A0A6S8FXF8_9STRA|mmetsp:Transcript_882/g.1095  ORF Transcript_882/g.1095 Transcript_882/m.1095 type:complete len:107 (+) Transcript_882:324-644(+)
MGDIEKIACWQKALAVETKVCATGTAWGLLDKSSTQVLVLWWAIRHTVYFGAAILLLINVEDSVTGFAIFFMAVHLYKLGRFLAKSENEQQKSAPDTKVNSTSQNV